MSETHPPDEEERLADLRRYEILDTPAEETFDRLTRLAARILQAPVALVSLVDSERQWFKSRVGLDLPETGRDVSFCTHALNGGGPLIVRDALEDPRFARNPLVTDDPGIRFYAGAPLVTPDGHTLGTLCVVDTRPRPGFSEGEATALADLAGTAMDLLELRRAALSLRESEQRFRSLFENARDVAFVRGIAGDRPDGYDGDGPTVYGSEAHLSGHADGHGRADVEGWRGSVHPDDRDAYLAALQRRRALGEPFTIDYRVADPSRGGWRWMHEVAWTVEDGGTGRTYLDGYILDVTAQKEAEAGLRAAKEATEARGRENELYRAMIDALPDYVFAKDRGGRFLAVNVATARVMGAQGAVGVVGRTDHDFYPPDIAARFAADEEAFYERGETTIIEQPGLRLDGSLGWLRSLKTPFRDPYGRTVGYVGHGRDVTEEKLRDEALAEARSTLERQAAELATLAEAAERGGRAKAEFLAAMSHEIRTPMTGVLGMADLLSAEELTGRQRGYVDAIRTSGRHLLSIINDILDFSRIDAGRLELERIDFPVAHVLEEVRSLLAPQAVDRGLGLAFELAPGTPPVVRGDPMRLRQVLLNLVGNALKFTGRGSVAVRVRATGGGPGLRFEVEDTGIGMTREQADGLFQPFAQADRSTARRFGGSGLGLAICRRLVDAMGGAIGAESEPGRGSTFWFELPLEEGDPAAAAASAARAAAAGDERAALAPPPAGLRPLRLLVAEDVPLNRDLLGDVLGRRGHAVTFASDGGEAVTLAARGGFDLVLMDVQMPVMDGIEATRRIRALPPPAGAVPVIALTANVMEAERRRCLAAGMDRVVAKPVAWPELFAAMDATLAGRPEEGAEPEPAPAMAAAPSPADLPPLDRAALAAAGAGMEPALLADFLREAVAEAARGQAALTEVAATGGRLADGEAVRLAHRLRGTAGSLGLSRVAALVGLIEEGAATGADLAALVRDLGDAVAATRDEVEAYAAGAMDPADA